MDIFRAAERLMSMNDAVWARHANPWSAYTRFAGSTPFFLALWSYHWIGWWSLVPIALAGLWTWLNPRLFAPVSDTSSWAAKGVLGERVYLNRKDIPVPDAFHRATLAIHIFMASFLLACVLGFVFSNFWAAFIAWHAAVLSKIWWVDRMVMLWDLMKDKDDRYRAWNRAEW